MAEYILGICAAAVAVIYLAIDARFPAAMIDDPVGPKIFPAIIGCGMLLSAIVIEIEARAKTRNALEVAVKPANDDEAGQRPKARLVLCCMAIWTLGYYAAFEPAGYLLATIVYVMGMLIYFHPNRWLTNIIIATGFTGVAYFVLAKLLGVALPQGLLGL